jgi:hypothetical protein
MDEGISGCSSREKSGWIEKNGDWELEDSMTLINHYIHTYNIFSSFGDQTNMQTDNNFNCVFPSCKEHRKFVCMPVQFDPILPPYQILLKTIAAGCRNLQAALSPVKVNLPTSLAKYPT